MIQTSFVSKVKCSDTTGGEIVFILSKYWTNFQSEML